MRGEWLVNMTVNSEVADRYFQQTGMPPWQAKWWTVPLWQGCRLLTSCVAVAVMLGTHTASVTGTELHEERPGSLGLRHTPGWVRQAGICWRVRGFQLLKHPDSIQTQQIDQQDSASAQEHTAPDLSFPSGRVVDMIAEMDLRWKEDSLFNTGWHFQGRDEVKATVSKERMSPQIWMLLVEFVCHFYFRVTIKL